MQHKRLNTAYMLKESFGQLWDYEREPWARKFFENWRASLKWQRLKRYEKFAQMIDDHWDGIAAYCKPQNQVSLGYVEGLNGALRERREEYKIDYRIVRHDGEVRWIESRLFIMYGSDATGHRLTGVNIDVTERKRAEALNKESNIRLADALTASQVDRL